MREREIAVVGSDRPDGFLLTNQMMLDRILNQRRIVLNPENLHQVVLVERDRAGFHIQDACNFFH